METETLLTMNQVSKELNVKSQTLRSFCNRGFVPGLKLVAPGKHRTFTTEQVASLRTAVFLSRAGFSTKDLRKYVRLTQDNHKAARQERLAMLKTHKRQVWQELEDLQATIDFLERQEEIPEAESRK